MSPRQFQRLKSKYARAPDARPCTCVSEEQGLPIFLLDFNPISFSLFLIYIFFLSGKVKYLLGKHIVQQTAPNGAKEFFAKNSSLSLSLAHICGLRCGTIAECHTICVKIITSHTLHVSESSTYMEGQLDGQLGELALPRKEVRVGGVCVILEPLT